MKIGNGIDDDRADYLRRKYITEPPPGPVALAEQLVKAMQDMRSEAEAWNAAQGCAWLNWAVPPSLRMVADRRLVRVREAMARESRGGGHYIHWYDDRNGSDEQNGWVLYDPDCPGHQNVPLGHILGDQKWGGKVTVHVLRGGTSPGLFDAREHLGRFERPLDSEPPSAGLPNWGDGYDFTTFMAHAEQMRMLRFCGVYLPTGCKNGIGGGEATLVAVPMGRDVFAMHLCQRCLAAAEVEVADISQP